MSLLTKAARAVQAAVMRFATSAGWSLLLLNRTKLDYARLVDPSLNSAIVACTNWVCRTFPEAPIQVLQQQRDGTETPIVGHPMVELLQRPNPHFSGELLLRATLVDWLAGEAFWRKVRNGYGAPVEVWWIPKHLIAPAWPSNDPTVFISHYEYTVNGHTEKIPVEDIVHFRNGIDPNNTRRGLSQYGSLLREVFTDDEAANFSASLLRNLGIPGVVISPGSDEGAITAEDGKAIKEDYKSKFSGDNRGEPMVLPSKVLVQPLSFNPQQMDLKTLRRLPEERVSAVLGIPAIVAGLGAGLDRSTFANMSEAREMAYESNIIPNQRLIAAELRNQLLKDFGDVKGKRVAFDLSGVRVLQEDQNKLWIRVDTAVRGGWMKVERAKTIVGEKPEPGDNIYLRPLSVVEVGPDAPEEEALPVTPPAAQPKLAGEEEPEGEEQGAEEEPEPPAKARRQGERKAARGDRQLVRRLNRESVRLAAAMADDLDGAFEDLAASLDITVGGGKAAKAANVVTGELATGESVTVRIPKGALDKFTGVYQANFGLIMQTTYGAVSDHLGVQLGVNLEDPVARRLIRQWATRKNMADIPAQTREAILQALADGRAAGEGAEDLGLRIRSMVRGRYMYPGVYQRAYDQAIASGDSESLARKFADAAASQARAETIARTETKTAQNKSSVYAYIDSEVVEALVVYDGDDCGLTSHDDPDKADGKTISFEDGLIYPLAHPRCVRSFAPKVRKTVE